MINLNMYENDAKPLVNMWDIRCYLFSVQCIALILIFVMWMYRCDELWMNLYWILLFSEWKHTSNQMAIFLIFRIKFQFSENIFSSDTEFCHNYWIKIITKNNSHQMTKKQLPINRKQKVRKIIIANSFLCFEKTFIEKYIHWN